MSSFSNPQGLHQSQLRSNRLSSFCRFVSLLKKSWLDNCFNLSLLTSFIFVGDLFDVQTKVLERIPCSLYFLVFFTAFKPITIICLFHLLEDFRHHILILFFVSICCFLGDDFLSLYFVLDIGIIVNLLLHHFLLYSVNLLEESVLFAHCFLNKFIMLAQFL